MPSGLGHPRVVRDLQEVFGLLWLGSDFSLAVGPPGIECEFFAP